MTAINNISKIPTHSVFFLWQRMAAGFLAVFILLNIFTVPALANTSVNSTASVIDSTVPSGGGGGGGGSYPLPPAVPKIKQCSDLVKSTDTNQDKQIDIFDFNLLMVHWGSAAKNDIADIN
jgi:hypothetical protein